MSAAPIYVVTAAAVKVRIGDPAGNGVARIVKRGGLIPADVSAEQIKHLTGRGLIEVVADEEPEAPAAKPVSKRSTAPASN